MVCLPFVSANMASAWFGENELRIVLLGVAGSGKSKTANLLLGPKDSFNSEPRSIRSIVKYSYRYQKALKIVDSPGLFGFREININQELDECLNLSKPGPHMFIVCVPMDRITDQTSKAVKKYVKYFGEDIYDFMIIAFTLIDQWELDNEELELVPDFEAYLEKLPANMKHLLQRCENRYCKINNRKTGDESTKLANQVIGKIIAIITSKPVNKRVYNRSNKWLMRSTILCIGVVVSISVVAVGIHFLKLL